MYTPLRSLLDVTSFCFGGKPVCNMAAFYIQGSNTLWPRVPQPARDCVATASRFVFTIYNWPIRMTVCKRVSAWMIYAGGETSLYYRVHRTRTVRAKELIDLGSQSPRYVGALACWRVEPLAIFSAHTKPWHISWGGGGIWSSEFPYSKSSRNRERNYRF
jgi:hypothetical protein